MKRLKFFVFLISALVAAFVMFSGLPLFAEETKLDFDKLFTSPSEKEIQDAFNDIPKNFTCVDFQEGKILYDSDEMEARAISYKSDGLKIYGILTRPKSGGKHPLLMYNHGGFSGLMSIDKQVYAEFVDKGYVVLASAYRGEDGPGGHSEGYVELARGEVTDILNLLECGKKLPEVDTNKIVFMGGSHGGVNSLMAGILSKDAKVIIDYVGPTNLFNKHFGELFKGAIDDFFRTGKFAILGSELSPELRRKFTDAMKDEKSIPFLRRELLMRSPLYFAKHMNAPVLMIYGGQDPLVPIKNAYEFEDALKKNKKTYELKVYEKAGHGFFGSAGQEEVGEMTFLFIEKYLK